jgi:predicted ATP-grasp superfamily ATP-dependent carboligase
MSGEDKARRYVEEIIDQANLRGRVKIDRILHGKKHFVVTVSAGGRTGTIPVSHNVNKKIGTNNRLVTANVVMMRRLVEGEKDR